MVDAISGIRDQLLEIRSSGESVSIEGGATKSFMGRKSHGTTLSMSNHFGVIAYEPTELVLTVRAGTPLESVESMVTEQGQMLGFEPPAYGKQATIGGTIACGVSGPRRAFAGAARDFTLGAKVMNSDGETLNFGGRVIKNVAGYDVSRLMVGAMGTLGIILEISIKVLPKPDKETTLAFECRPPDAIKAMTDIMATTLPVTAAAFVDGRLLIRLAGTSRGVKAARRKLGGETEESQIWSHIKELSLANLASEEPLWRVSVPSNSPLADISGLQLIDWGGGLRWYKSSTPAATFRDAVTSSGGHATLFRGGNRDSDVFQVLPEPLMALHRRTKEAFDPLGLFNPGRMYAGI